MNKQRKRRSLIWLFLLLPLLCIGLWYDSNLVLHINSFPYKDEDLPEGFAGFSMVQLSDLHGYEFGENNEKLLSEVKKLQPEVILLTGDLQDRFRNTPEEYVTTLCKGLMEIAPTYYITGNHEWAVGGVGALKAALTELGVTVLSNEAVPLERNGDTIILAGIDDPNGYADQKRPEELAAEVRETYGEDIFWMLLAHRNNYFEKEYAALGADLVISGHAHGGLIRLPFTDGLISVERTLFPSFTNGFYTVEGSDSTLFVSRGLGNSGISFRLFNGPQIVSLTLEKE